MTIKDLPILDQMQFYFSANMPFMGDLIKSLQGTPMKKELMKPSKDWSPHLRLALHITFETRTQLVVSKEAMKENGDLVVLNAFRQLQEFIKKGTSRKQDRVPVIAWYVLQVIDMPETAKYNNLTLYTEEDLKNLSNPEYINELLKMMEQVTTPAPKTN